MSSSNRAKGAPSSPERSQVDAIHAVAQSVRASAAAATAAYEQAREAHAAASAALAEAEEQYASAPDEGAGVHSAERSLRLAGVRLEAEKKKQVEAARAVEGANAALSAATLDAKKAELSERSTPDALANAIADPWRVALAAYEAVDRAVTKIREAVADSHRASSELRSIGVYTRDLDEIHALMPPLEALAARGIVVADLNAARLPVSRLTVSDVVRFLETHGAAPPSPHADSYRARLGRVKNTRTMLEAAALEDLEAREQTALAMASYKRPAATRATLGLAPPPVAPAALLAPSEASEARPSVAPRRGARE